MNGRTREMSVKMFMGGEGKIISCRIHTEGCWYAQPSDERRISITLYPVGKRQSVTVRRNSFLLGTVMFVKRVRHTVSSTQEMKI